MLGGQTENYSRPEVGFREIQASETRATITMIRNLKCQIRMVAGYREAAERKKKLGCGGLI
jgi:hypothetical protein